MPTTIVEGASAIPPEGHPPTTCVRSMCSDASFFFACIEFNLTLPSRARPFFSAAERNRISGCHDQNFPLHDRRPHRRRPNDGRRCRKQGSAPVSAEQSTRHDEFLHLPLLRRDAGGEGLSRCQRRLPGGDHRRAPRRQGGRERCRARLLRRRYPLVGPVVPSGRGHGERVGRPRDSTAARLAFIDGLDSAMPYAGRSAALARSGRSRTATRRSRCRPRSR